MGSVTLSPRYILTPPPAPPLQGRGVPTESPKRRSRRQQLQAVAKAAAAPLPCTTLYTHLAEVNRTIKPRRGGRTQAGVKPLHTGRGITAPKGRRNTGRGVTPAHWVGITAPKESLTPPPAPPLQGRGVPTESPKRRSRRQQLQAVAKAAAAPLPCRGGVGGGVSNFVTP